MLFAANAMKLKRKRKVQRKVESRKQRIIQNKEKQRKKNSVV